MAFTQLAQVYCLKAFLSKKITNKVRERVKYRREQDRRLISEEENVYICPQT